MEQNAQKEREKILEIKNLSMEFPAGKKKTVKALNNVTFDIYKGENFGLVGESGCGKTTLLNLILGIIKADSGQILYDGEDLTEVSMEKRGFNIVFQDYALFPKKQKLLLILIRKIYGYRIRLFIR